MDDLRSWWEVPSIAHFCSLFRTAFDLTDFDIEDLEEAFLESEKEEGSEFILDILCRLLNGCYHRKDVSAINYDLYVKDIIKYKWEQTDNPIREKSEFKELTLREKVDLIHVVCEYRLDAEDVPELLKGFDGDNMRVEPLGKDKEGATYWYFYGNRLYKEDPEPKKELTKEQKRAKDLIRRQELKRKRDEEKTQKKKEKHQKRSAKKLDKKKKKVAEKIKEPDTPTNTRRSGRIKIKQMMEEDSDSSDTTSSEEEETEESVSEEEPVVEEEEQEKPKSRRGRGRPTTPAKKETPVKKETPARSSGRKKTPARNQTPTPSSTRSGRKCEVQTPQLDSGTRRSGRLRNKVEQPPPPDDSDTELDDMDDIDSGHESAATDDDTKSIRSEMSKTSAPSTPSSRSRRPGRAPQAKLELRRKTVEDCKDDEEDMDITEPVVNKEKSATPPPEVTAGDDTPSVNGQAGVTDDIQDNMDVDEGKDTSGTDDKSPKPTDQVNGEEKADINIEQDSSNNGERKDDLENIKPQTDNTMKENCDVNEEKSEEVPEVKTKMEEKDTEVNKTDSEVKTENNTDETNKESNGISEEISEMKKEETEMASKVADDDSESVGKDIKEEQTDNKQTVKTEIKEENDVEDDKDVKIEKEDVKPEIKTPVKPAVRPEPSKSVTRWHLICSTLDDWINLAEWFKDSTVRCEKSLSKMITEDFLPVLPEIIEARDAEKMKRLQELELRRSDRITYKQREKMESEKILAEGLANEEKARIQFEEERRLKEEQLRLEEENKQREERIKAREERANRLYIREEKSRLLAEGKEIPPELIYTGASKYKDDSDSDDSRRDLKDDASYEALLKVINAMKLHKDCWPFLEPVTDEEAPGYSDVIKRPMDLSTIQKKVKMREYRASSHFMSDFRLMFNNCKRFNGQESEFSECARSMEKMLKKYFKRFISDEPTDSYYVDKDFNINIKGGTGGQDKKFRPRRAASSKAMETVKRALGSGDEEEDSSSDDDNLEPLYRRKVPQQSSIKTPSHHSLLLQEMIELKRQREKKLAASALQNHQVITRGPERVRIQNPNGGGVMIIPREDLPPTGVLRLAATRELKRKINPVTAGRRSQSPGSPGPNLSKRDPSINVIDARAPGSKQPKTIRIVAASQTSSGNASVKETAESVKVSSDGYLIIGGKNSGIKVSENTKIVIQPPGPSPSQGQGGTQQQSTPLGREIFIKKIPTPTGMRPLPTSNSPNPQQNTLYATKVSSASPGVPQVQVQNSSIRPAVVNIPKQTNQLQQQSPQAGIITIDNQPTTMSQGSSPSQAAAPADLRNKQMDIAQRIQLLNQHKRKLIQQQQILQSQQHQSQLGGGDGNPPKIIKLQSIEDRLRDSNIESQVGAVTKDVVNSVNIKGDILDTYYSVLNASKTNSIETTKPAIVNFSPSQSRSIPTSKDVAQNLRNMIINARNSGQQLSPGKIVQSAQNVNGPNVQNIVTQSPVNSMPRQVNTLIQNQSNILQASKISLPQTATPQPKVSITGFEQIIQNQSTGIQNVIGTQSRLPGVTIMPEIFTATPKQQTASVTELTPIEALFTGNTSIQNTPPSVISVVNNQTAKVIPKPVIVEHESLNCTPINVTNVSALAASSGITVSIANVPNVQNPNLAPVSNFVTLPNQISNLNSQSVTDQTTLSQLPNIGLLENNPLNIIASAASNQMTNQGLSQVQYIASKTVNPNTAIVTDSPSKMDRANLFDAFKASAVVVDQTTKAGNMTANLPTVAGDFESKGRSRKLIAETVNFGSPLKTMSVMEALKSKLNPVKSEQHPTIQEPVPVDNSSQPTQQCGMPSPVAYNHVESSNSSFTLVESPCTESHSPNSKVDSSKLDIDSSISQCHVESPISEVDSPKTPLVKVDSSARKLRSSILTQVVESITNDKDISEKKTSSECNDLIVDVPCRVLRSNRHKKVEKGDNKKVEKVIKKVKANDKPNRNKTNAPKSKDNTTEHKNVDKSPTISPMVELVDCEKLKIVTSLSNDVMDGRNGRITGIIIRQPRSVMNTRSKSMTLRKDDTGVNKEDDQSHMINEREESDSVLNKTFKKTKKKSVELDDVSDIVDNHQTKQSKNKKNVKKCKKDKDSNDNEIEMKHEKHDNSDKETEEKLSRTIVITDSDTDCDKLCSNANADIHDRSRENNDNTVVDSDIKNVDNDDNDDNLILNEETELLQASKEVTCKDNSLSDICELDNDIINDPKDILTNHNLAKTFKFAHSGKNKTDQKFYILKSPATEEFKSARRKRDGIMPLPMTFPVVDQDQIIRNESETLSRVNQLNDIRQGFYGNEHTFANSRLIRPLIRPNRTYKSVILKRNMKEEKNNHFDVDSEDESNDSNLCSSSIQVMPRQCHSDSYLLNIHSHNTKPTITTPELMHPQQYKKMYMSNFGKGSPDSESQNEDFSLQQYYSRPLYSRGSSRGRLRYPYRHVSDQSRKTTLQRLEDLEKDLSKIRLHKKLERLSAPLSTAYQLAGIRPKVPPVVFPLPTPSPPVVKHKRRTHNKSRLSKQESDQIKLSRSTPDKRVYHVPRRIGINHRMEGNMLEMSASDSCIETGFISDEEAKIELDRSLNDQADFFDPELLTHLFSPNPGLNDGDGLNDSYTDVDHDLEEIENDIFDLQDTYLGHRSSPVNRNVYQSIELNTIPVPVQTSLLTGYTHPVTQSTSTAANQNQARHRFVTSSEGHILQTVTPNQTYSLTSMPINQPVRIENVVNSSVYQNINSLQNLTSFSSSIMPNVKQISRSKTEIPVVTNNSGSSLTASIPETFLYDEQQPVYQSNSMPLANTDVEYTETSREESFPEIESSVVEIQANSAFASS